jgi:hypothetical protein
LVAATPPGGSELPANVNVVARNRDCEYGTVDAGAEREPIVSVPPGDAVDGQPAGDGEVPTDIKIGTVGLQGGNRGHAGMVGDTRTEGHPAAPVPANEIVDIASVYQRGTATGIHVGADNRHGTDPADSNWRETVVPVFIAGRGRCAGEGNQEQQAGESSGQGSVLTETCWRAWFAARKRVGFTLDPRHFPGGEDWSHRLHIP